VFFLVAVVLTSCNSFVSTATASPTDVMETAVALAWTEVAETQASAPTATPSPPLPTPISSTPIPPTQIPFFTFSVDRHDPESVIRAYFDAWVRSDSSAMASVLSHNNGYFIFEPMNSISILEIKLISDSSSRERIYSVLYDVQWKVQEGSGKIRWSFTLEWNANRDSWLIDHYGYGTK